MKDSHYTHNTFVSFHILITDTVLLSLLSFYSFQLRSMINFIKILIGILNLGNGKSCIAYTFNPHYLLDVYVYGVNKQRK